MPSAHRRRFPPRSPRRPDGSPLRDATPDHGLPPESWLYGPPTPEHRLSDARTPLPGGPGQTRARPSALCKAFSESLRTGVSLKPANIMPATGAKITQTDIDPVLRET